MRTRRLKLLYAFTIVLSDTTASNVVVPAVRARHGTLTL